MSGTIRYSDEELDNFRMLIERKLEKAKGELDFIEGQIRDISEAIDNVGDWMDDPSSRDVEMLYTMASRQRKHVRDLENALIRVKNKNYGICVVTGELIDKRRLLAVLTTSKSLEAKNAPPVEKPNRKNSTVKKDKVKTITKVIRKPVVAEQPLNELTEDEFDDNFDDLFDNSEFDDIDDDNEDNSN